MFSLLGSWTPWVFHKLVIPSTIIVITLHLISGFSCLIYEEVRGRGYCQILYRLLKLLQWHKVSIETNIFVGYLNHNLRTISDTCCGSLFAKGFIYFGNHITENTFKPTAKFLLPCCTQTFILLYKLHKRIMIQNVLHLIINLDISIYI